MNSRERVRQALLCRKPDRIPKALGFYNQSLGAIAPKPHGGGTDPAYTGARLEALRRAVRQQPDATLRELRERTGVACSLVTVHNTLKRLGLRFKKRRSTPGSRTGQT